MRRKRTCISFEHIGRFYVGLRIGVNHRGLQGEGIKEQTINDYALPPVYLLYEKR